MRPARLSGWLSRPIGAVKAWNADLARLDTDRQTSTHLALEFGVLAALGLGLLALVVWMARLQPLAAHPRAFAAGLLAQLALYGAAAGWVCWRKPPARWALLLVVLVAVGARLAYVPRTPSASDDIYRYVWDGRIQAQGINPYRFAPDDPALAALRDDAIYPHINRKPVHTIYPPAAQMLFRGLYALRPDSVTWTKLAFSAIDLVTIAVIAGLLMRLGLRPERVLLFAWHPLLILEIAHSGHLDGVMLCVLALAMRARLQGHAMRTGTLLAGAALLKFYALAALPALLFGERRRDTRVLGALSLTALLAYLPFLSVGTGVFGYLGGYAREEGLASGGRFYLLGRARQLLEATPGVTWLFGGLPLSDARLYQGVVLLTLAALALWCWRAPRAESRTVMTRAALLFVTLLALTTPAYPWYTLLLLLFVPALRGRLLLPALTIVSLAGFLYLQWWWPGHPRWPLDLVYGAGALSLALVAGWALLAAVARGWPDGHPLPPSWRLGPASRAVPAPIDLPVRRARVDAERAAHARTNAPAEAPSLFDRFPWFYAFCREHLFRDHTRLIAAGLWPAGAPRAGDELLEIGCGPGFYARRFAQRHAELRVSGLDRSHAQLRHARRRATTGRLANCRFEHGDALRLPRAAGEVDATIVARLFTVLPERELALAEVHRVLCDGGRCFIAEPRSRVWTAVPLRALWLLAGMAALLRCQPGSNHYREPRRATVLSVAEFGALIDSQPWRRVRVWRDRRYHYALCVKAARSAVLEQALAAD